MFDRLSQLDSESSAPDDALSPSRGVVVLCGGKSSRMGYSKALLPFGPETLLQRVVRIAAEVVSPQRIVVVAAGGQNLPSLPKEVVVAYDDRSDRGPLEGLAAGLAALAGRAEIAYVTSCDVPLLRPALVEKMFDSIGDHDIVVPREEKFYHPLAACYRTSVLAHVRVLLEADRLRPFFLFERCSTREILIEELRSADAQLDSLKNLNTPHDYFAALKLAGLPVSPQMRLRLRV